MALILNTTEIASALINFEATYPELCRRLQLPKKTYEGRVCHALQIAKGHAQHKPVVLIIAGVHAREWGGPDIVVNFAGDLLRAYSKGKGLQYLKKTFLARDIRTIVEESTLVVFPCVNPDGVEFSHTKRYLWRKNRNPAHSKGDAKKIGVDINRNYDFMWDFKKFFHPAAWTDSLASDNPAIETFHGPEPFSEPETQNVRWLMDRFNPVLFLDLHSYDGDVLFSWGSDENQITDPSQNFINPAYNGKRGRIGDTYREYLSMRDYETATGIATAVSDAMRDVRNRPSGLNQDVFLHSRIQLRGGHQRSVSSDLESEDTRQDDARRHTGAYRFLSHTANLGRAAFAARHLVSVGSSARELKFGCIDGVIETTAAVCPGQ